MMYVKSKAPALAQRELIRYWETLAAKDPSAIPERSAINPWHLGVALADISLLEVGDDGQVTFRLAGSSITALAGRSLKGVPVDTLDGALSGLWALGVTDALETGQPVVGRVDGAIDGRDLVWLRLPLRDQDGKTRLVLCHDGWARPQASKQRDSEFIPGRKAMIAA